MKMSFERLKRGLQGQGQAKSIIIIFLMCSAFFVMLQNGNQIGVEEMGPDNNYGIDCAKGLAEDIRITLGYRTIKYQTKERLLLYHRPLLNCMSQDSKHLIDVIRDDFLIKPDLNRKMKLNFKESILMETRHQAKDVVDMIFKDKGGFFIEAGAMDCEDSITLPLEYNYGWKGLLVEALPERIEICKKLNRRRSHLINTCLATQDKPHFADFSLGGEVYTPENSSFAVQVAPGFVSDNENNRQKPGSLVLQCFPFYSLLLAMGNPTVNLFVLDIEGFELSVLETIPWHKVDIEVLDVETDLAGVFQKDSSREKIINLMEKNGYERFDHRNDYNEMTKRNQNDLFVRKDIVKKYNVKQLREDSPESKSGGKQKNWMI